MVKITLPPQMKTQAVRKVFAALSDHNTSGIEGDRARFVGGCVRNILLEKTVNDLDIATTLTPDEVEQALANAGIKSVPTGKLFGTITAVTHKQTFEITSLRQDVQTDGRRAVVKFTTDWAEDAQRRDFYINALYCDPDGEIYDPTGQGLSDIKAHRVRFIGEAQTRIREDYLRILRFFRFSEAYGRGIDEASLSACIALKDGIDALSGERISQEFFKILAGENAISILELMAQSGILNHILPVIDWQGELLNTTRALNRLNPRKTVKLMGLLYDVKSFSHEANALLSQRLKFSNALKKELNTAVVVLSHAPKLGEDNSWLKIRYIYGDLGTLDAFWLKAAISNINPEVAQIYKNAFMNMALPQFSLKASDLLALGVETGAKLGAHLKQIESDWVDNDFSQGVIDKALENIRVEIER